MAIAFGSARRVLTAFALAAAALTITGCASNDGLAAQFRSGDNKNYIAGDGTVTEFKTERPGPVEWAGESDLGGQLSSANLTGVPIVMNFWYAGCAPCRAEAPLLAKLAREFDGKVQFVGVNVRDSAATANAFERNFKISYPSIIDNSSGSVALAFTGIVTPQAVPTTLVIDKAGKVSARILGRADESTLHSLIVTVAN
jgi:thiol-disulfide isomerase/thioredoxin